MKVSVPSSYSRVELGPAKVREIRSGEEPRELQSSPEPQPKTEQRLPLLPIQWWQGFLYGNSDGLLSGRDATRAVCLIADRLGKEVGQLELGASIRAGELRKIIYAKFGADLALHTMHELWRQAATNGELSNATSVPETSGNVIKFFEAEDPTLARRRESVEERAERERLTDLGGWAGC
jgi:hypothetical protein